MPFPGDLDAQVSLRLIFGCHFVLTAFVLMGSWPGNAYLFYNGALLAFLVWAELAPPMDSELPLLKSFVAEASSIVLDIILMAARYYGGHGVETFALVMAILHLLGRFPSCYVLFRLREDRRSIQYGTSAGGTTAASFGGNQAGPGGYEEFPPSYGAGGGTAAGGAGYSSHDTKPLPP